MKKLNALPVFFALLILCLASCKKGDDGATGPAGSTGATGAQGVVGPAGPKGADGKDGSVIYSGNTLPAATTGVVGDFYLNVATGLLYGPKTGEGWGAGFSLKGPAGATGATGATGAAGANGNTTLSGSGAPSASLGNVGDFYLDKTSYFLYGPKTGTGWGPAVNLRGPAGPAGTANVIYSDWIKPDVYTKTTIFGTIHFSYTITAAKITQDILDKGTVIVYGKLNGYNPVIWPTDNVAALPIVITYMSGTNSNIDTWSGIASLGAIQIDLTSSLNAYSSISNAHSFRYVIIPGGVHTTAVAKQLNINDYESVRKYYHITD
ncbi:hypothetical protein SAMN05216464_10334 [Mucilaginibacter pineti]|uniref:Collagen triple helix repeat-containing protein n=1 Tax=Mucilaginibacter pineti TaxID=1391627 RepID=A0A1G6YQA1_9SPHI|nr:collagen-like protein [Mucilaginibacter pineti]SDD91726.1 hypothetical protein SAMN05216464_10334 [Mucilaginibacter pineti]